jgi:hypothetical protein
MASPTIYMTNNGLIFQIHNLTSDQSRLLLIDKPIGTFLIRNSVTDPEKIAISFVHDIGKILHIRFLSVSEFIEYIEMNNCKITTVESNISTFLTCVYINDVFYRFPKPYTSIIGSSTVESTLATIIIGRSGPDICVSSLDDDPSSLDTI